MKYKAEVFLDPGTHWASPLGAPLSVAIQVGDSASHVLLTAEKDGLSTGVWLGATLDRPLEEAGAPALACGQEYSLVFGVREVGRVRVLADHPSR